MQVYPILHILVYYSLLSGLNDSLVHSLGHVGQCLWCVLQDFTSHSWPKLDTVAINGPLFWPMAIKVMLLSPKLWLQSKQLALLEHPIKVGSRYD